VFVAVARYVAGELFPYEADSLLRPLKRDKWQTMLSLVRMREKGEDAMGLVKISAKLSLLEMKRTANVLAATLSRTK
jgi:hypothetical protein